MKKISARRKKWIKRTVMNDRSYKLFLYNRFFIFLLLVLFQIVGYVALMYLFAYASAIGVILQAATSIFAIVTVLYLINKNQRPSVKLNWILLILLLPVIGVPMYLLYGEGRPTRRMNKKIQRAVEENDKVFKSVYGNLPQREAQTRGEMLDQFLYKYSGYPAYYDGNVDYFDSGEKIFTAIKEELAKAERFILIEYFIIAHGKMWGDILKLLLEKAGAGVQIRIIYDDFGCMMTLPPDYDKYLESLHENIRCLSFNEVVPLFAVRMNNRDHRKILVIDGKVAFTGGVNLADEYIGEKRRFGHWKDSGLRVTGNAVASFTRMFFYLWNAFRTDKEDIAKYLIEPSKEENAGIVHPYDDSPLDKLSIGETVYVDLIDRAIRCVYIFTPYLILDDSMRTALCRAAARGVDVRIVTPGIPDKKTVYRLTRANYGILMEAGIKIYEYTPGFIHAKSMLCDGESAVVGTINLDYRILFHHFENAVYFSNCQAVEDLKRDCEETFAVCRLCNKENSKRSVLGRLFDSILRVFETLL